MVASALFVSERDDWPTPWKFFLQLDREFNFTLDVCATPLSAKVLRYCVPPSAPRVWDVETFRRLFPDALVDGLTQSWTGERCFMNPPYGRKIGAWVAKARREAERGVLPVGLLPAHTDTAWFHMSILMLILNFYAVASSLKGRRPSVWTMLLERASESEERGKITGFDCETVDVYLGLRDGATRAIMDAMEAKGMIAGDTLCKWSERQVKKEDETATERKRLQREREKLEKERLALEARYEALERKMQELQGISKEKASNQQDVTECHATSHDVTLD